MEDAMAAAAIPLLHGLLDEIVLWEILVLLDPKSLLRCRSVCRAWHYATSTRCFLLAHHARQPSLIIFHSERCHNITAFDHRASATAKFHTITRLDEPFNMEASCDGLLILSRYGWTDSGSRTHRLTVWNPATREHASLGVLRGDLRILGMYPYRPTSEYRLLLQGNNVMGVSKGQNGCYVLPLVCDQPPRYIGRMERVSPPLFETPTLIRDGLHWFLMKHTKRVLVFNTATESIRHMRAPVLPGSANLFEMDGTFGIHSFNDYTEIVNIWVLRDYENEVRDLKYRIKSPVVEIMEQFEDNSESWVLGVIWENGDVILLLSFGGCLLHVDSDGKLIDNFNCDHRDLCMYEYRLKQSLVQHTFFPALKRYAISVLPLI